MVSEELHRGRRRFGFVLVAALGLVILWVCSPGLPVLWGPWASAKTKEAGRELFEHEWEPNDPLAGGDGLGPVFNARSCVACHSQGGVGGSGSKDHNVVVFEVHPTPSDPEVHSGVIHAAAIDASFKESISLVTKRFPVVRGGSKIVCGRRTAIPDFNPVRLDTTNSPALFGDGWIDRIAAKAITNNRVRRVLANAAHEFELNFDSPPVGRARVLPDGRIGKFGWKAQFATLEEFVAKACANELGLGTPTMEQARSMARMDYDAQPDLTKDQFNALVAFVDTLPRPQEILPDNSVEQDQALRGKGLFSSIGCAACHTPDIGGVKGVYSDFLLYRIDGQPPGTPGGSYGNPEIPELPPFPEDHPRPDEWKTPALWGVADSAPYFHDGNSTTLREAILRHGGDAASITKAFTSLDSTDQTAVIAFLNTLKAPPEAIPAKKANSETMTARR